MSQSGQCQHRWLVEARVGTEALEQLADAAQARNAALEGTPLGQQIEVMSTAYAQLGTEGDTPLFAEASVR